MALRHFFRDLGRNIRFKRNNPGISLSDSRYEDIRPSPGYSPWNVDEEFAACYQTIRDFTLVDKYRCYGLWSLVEQAAPLNGAFIEVGSWRGGSGALIARKAQLHNITDPVLLCDTFRGVVKAGPNDTAYKGGEHADTTRETAERLVHDTLHLDNVRILEGIFPDETGNQAEDLEFRFCHIDVDVYDSAKGVLQWVWPRLVPGGVVVYDDYGFSSTAGITKHVEEEMHHADRVFIHNLNGHAVFIKLR